MRWPRYRSPLARAVIPVLAGIGFFVVLGVLTWAAAAYIAHHSDQRSSDFAPTTFDVGGTKTLASIVADDGPLIFPDLYRASGKRSIVLDHTGADVDRNWQVYLAYPADRAVECKVAQIKHTRTFTDCDGRTIPVEDLAVPPAGVEPIVSANGKLTLDLLPDVAPAATTASTSAECPTSSAGCTLYSAKWTRRSAAFGGFPRPLAKWTPRST